MRYDDNHPYAFPILLPSLIQCGWIYRWTKLRSFKRQLSRLSGYEETGGSSTVGHTATVTGSPSECYACTQVGVPVFHSTSCEGAHDQPPQWEASAGSSLFPAQTQTGPDKAAVRGPYGLLTGPFGRVLDPRSKKVLLHIYHV